ncbi:amidohydrolase family protein, partial [Pseudomonas ceruminis]|uniref:amidohydrolase family protein n=1 Tax=Pseudomonas ceruminis TaxID=2740516 RepID=UPI00159713AE
VVADEVRSLAQRTQASTQEIESAIASLEDGTRSVSELMEQSQNLTFARQALGALEAHYGAERLMWGSDWPHTQHEAAVSFATVVEQFEALGCSAELRRAL